LNERCWYPDARFRFEYVASVVEPSVTVSVSYAVVVVRSELSMCSQNDSVYVLQPLGIVIDWDSVSVCVRP